MGILSWLCTSVISFGLAVSRGNDLVRSLLLSLTGPIYMIYAIIRFNYLDDENI